MATKKKSTTTAAATKKAAPRKSTAKKPKAVEVRSFKRAPRTTPFMTYRFTQQSLYWMLIGALVIALGAWVMYLNMKIQRIYDQVEINSALHEAYEFEMHHKVTPKE